MVDHLTASIGTNRGACISNSSHYRVNEKRGDDYNPLRLNRRIEPNFTDFNETDRAIIGVLFKSNNRLDTNKLKDIDQFQSTINSDYILLFQFLVVF